MREYGRRLPYRVVMVVQCKACGKPLESVEEAEGHVESGECFAMMGTNEQGEMGEADEDRKEEVKAGHMGVKRGDVIEDEDLQMQDMEDGEIEG